MRILGGIAAVLLLAACGSSGGSPATSHGATSASKPNVPTFDVHGEYSIEAVIGGPDGFDSSGTSCAGKGSASSIVPGATVKVESVTGATLATGKLAGGVTTAGNQVGDFAYCVFTFTVAGVPDGQTFYRLAVGSRPADQLAAAKMHSKVRITYLAG